jgi:hypothetical protein
VLGNWRQTGRQGFSRRAFERSVDLLQGDFSTTMNEQPDFLVMSSSWLTGHEIRTKLGLHRLACTVRVPQTNLARELLIRLENSVIRD